MVQAIQVPFPTAGAKLSMPEKAAWSLGWLSGDCRRSRRLL